MRTKKTFLKMAIKYIGNPKASDMLSIGYDKDRFFVRKQWKNPHNELYTADETRTCPFFEGALDDFSIWLGVRVSRGELKQEEMDIAIEKIREEFNSFKEQQL